MPRLAALFLLLLSLAAAAFAHGMQFTRLSLSLAATEAELRIETDPVRLLGDREVWRALLLAPPADRDARLATLAPEVLADLAPAFSPPGSPWRLVATATEPYDAAQFDAAGHVWPVAFVWRAAPPPATPDALFAVASRPEARVVFPVACTLLRPEGNGALTRWIETPGAAIRPFAVPAASAAPAANSPTEATRDETLGATIVAHLRLGFLHILPRGADHILFVLGLFFLGAGWRALAAQIGVFTLAHTTTLGLAAAGVVRVSPAVVEPLIALSIGFIALENIFRPRIGPGRLTVVFAFGLLHGLGFAGALAELELPREHFLSALLAFNVGVDFGQLAVLALAFATVGWFRARPWYRAKIAVPACALIAATGLYWTAERVFF